MHIEELIRQHGYWMVVFGTLFEGDATMLASSFLASRGYFNIYVVCWLVGITTTIQNQVLYEFARSRGPALAEGTGKMAIHIQKALGWIRKYGALLLFASRFMLGVRSTAGLACGIAQMPRGVFFWTNLAGAIVWTVAFGFAGYSGVSLLATLGADIKKHEVIVAAIVAVVVTLFVLWKSRAEEIVDLFGTAVIIEKWAISGLLRRRNKTSPKSSK
jgi:membrane protein DedA with SNARE-associated domain